MKKWIAEILVLVVAGMLIGLVVVPTFAQGSDHITPTVMNYQGYLTNPSGDPISDTLQMVFSIYSGTMGGVAVWTETHPSVTVSDGLFNVILGNIDTPITAAHLDEHRYLGINVDGDGEMAPRQRLTSTPYALRADKAKSANALDARDGDPENVLMVDYDGNIGINNMFPKGELHVGDRLLLTEGFGTNWFITNNAYYDSIWRYMEADEASRIALEDDGDFYFQSVAAGAAYAEIPWGLPSMIIKQSGNVGIGLMSPQEKLDVSGTIQATALNITGDIYTTGTVSATTFVGDGSKLTGISGDNLGNHTATQNIQLNGFYLSGDGNYEGVYVDNDGEVGIGTSSPNSKLHISDQATIPQLRIQGASNSDVIYPMIEFAENAAGLCGIQLRYLGASDELRFTGGCATPADIMTIERNGGVGIGTTNPTGLFEVSHDGSSHDLVANSYGNIGIGTSDAGEKLEVVGDIKVSGTECGIVFPDGTKQNTIERNRMQIALLRWWEVNETGIEYYVGNNPTDIAFDGENIWVTNYSDGTVSKLLTLTGTTIGTYSAGNTPTGITYDGENIWVSNKFDDTVTKILASDGSTVGTYNVEGDPEDVVFDGKHIWVANSGSNSVTKRLASNGSLVGHYSAGANPSYLAFDGENIWISGDGSSMVIKMKASDGSIVDTFSFGGSTQGLVFDGVNLWVSHGGAGQLLKLRASNGNILGSYPLASGAFSMAFDGANIWTANYNDQSVSKYRASDGALLGNYAIGEYLTGIAFDGANIWVTGGIPLGSVWKF